MMQTDRTPGEQLSEDLREQLLAEYRKRLFVRRRFIFIGIGLLLLALAVKCAVSADLKTALFCIVIAALMIAPNSISTAAAARYLRCVKTGAFTYHIGTLQRRARNKNAQNEVQNYQLIFDGLTVSCSMMDFRQALEGDRYALFFFQADTPAYFIRLDNGKQNFPVRKTDGTEMPDVPRQRLMEKYRHNVRMALLAVGITAILTAVCWILFFVSDGTLEAQAAFVIFGCFLLILLLIFADVLRKVYKSLRRVRAGAFTYHVGTVKELDHTQYTSTDSDGTTSTTQHYHLTVDIWDFECASYAEYCKIKRGDQYAVVFLDGDTPACYIRMEAD